VEELLAGDAAARAVVAAAFGRSEALAASGSDWEARVLAELIDDPYAAVRHVALESLRALPGFGDFRADFVAGPEARRSARKAALGRYAALGVSRRDAALPLDTRGQPDEARIGAVLGARDQHPTTISE
jgi:hypothetical protein